MKALYLAGWAVCVATPVLLFPELRLWEVALWSIGIAAALSVPNPAPHRPPSEPADAARVVMRVGAAIAVSVLVTLGMFWLLGVSAPIASIAAAVPLSSALDAAFGGRVAAPPGSPQQPHG
jgi:hypothetical protein